MTPPPSVSHTAEPAAGAFRARQPATASLSLGRLLNPRAWVRVRMLCDVACLGLACSAALFAAPAGSAMSVVDQMSVVAFGLVAFALLCMRAGPDELLSGSLLETLGHVAGIVSLAAMAVVGGDVVLGDAHPGRLALRLWLFSAVYAGLGRVVLLSVRRQALRTTALSMPTLIVGAGIVGEKLARRLSTDRGYGLRPVGFVDPNPLPRRSPEAASLPVFGGLEDLPRALEQTGARRVIVAFSEEPDHLLARQLRLCQELGVEVSLVPRLYESINERTTLDRVGGVPLLTLRPTDPRGWQFAVKHALDRSVAFLALLLLSPLMLTLALAVKLSSPGPILFRQRRVGRDGHFFDLLKFRTMQMPADEDLFEPPPGCAPGGIEGEDRRTAVGRLLRTTSLDELPQLLNVLRGDMSLVGPRPERPEYVVRFVSEHERYEDRHRVKSGITGWAQVCGLRGQTSIADRVEWDNYYIQNWSLRLDLRIIVLTALEVMRFRG